VEEFAGKMVAARKIIRQGCEAAPDAEDVWLEAARLHDRDNAKTILAQGVKNLPSSVKIWLLAADMETTDDRKKIVLRRALEFIPSSVKLWKTAIELENVEDARIMLARAVECVPHSVDMWLALAKLETYENARKVLNMAREAIPTDPLIWITAAKLEEACHPDPTTVVERIIEKAIASLGQNQVVIEREKWLKDAEAAEHSGAPLVCGAIVRQTIKLGVDDEDRMLTWLDDADMCLSRPTGPSVVTARAVYAYALTQFPKKTEVWLDAVRLEKEYGTRESLEELLRQSVLQCPQAEILWLMGAKEKWLAGQVPAARAILMDAFAANPNSEQIWLAAVKLEWENNEIERARLLLSKARDRASTETVWLKSALLARERGDVDETLALLDEAIAKYPTFAKFYMMAGQCCVELLKDNSRAKNYYQLGMKNCPESTTLVILTVQLYETTQGVSKARSLIELARLKSPANENLWLETVRLERRNKNEKLAETLMARALQECPSSGILWAEELLTCPKPSQKSKSIDALKKCNDDPFVIVAVARLFERDRKILKARKWFNRAVTLNSDLGDAWAHYYAFEVKASGPNAPETVNVLEQCVTADPRHGELWCSVSKQTANRRKDTATILKKIIVEKIAKIEGDAK
jgi:pre-mRNA-processing factor 6